VLGSGSSFKAHIHVLVSRCDTLRRPPQFILILIGAAIICAAAGALIGLPTLRLRGTTSRSSSSSRFINIGLSVTLPHFLARGGIRCRAAIWCLCESRTDPTRMRACLSTSSFLWLLLIFRHPARRPVRQPAPA